MKEGTIWCRDHRSCTYTFPEALERIRAFHGHVAPGLVIGLKMVDLARRHLPENIRQGGAGCLSLVPVEILPALLTRPSKGPIATCPQCGEAYPAAQGDLCRGCQGQSPYVRP